MQLSRRQLLAGLGAAAGYMTACGTSPKSPKVETPKEAGASSYEALDAPHLQSWGFDNRDPIVDMGGYRMSFQVFTKDNTFGIANGKFTVRQNGNRWELHAGELSWAAQQETAPGILDARAEKMKDRMRLEVRASTTGVIRGIKATIYQLPYQKAAWSVSDELHPITRQGILYAYPSWSASMPFILLAGSDGRGTCFNSTDLEPRPKRFASYQGKHGTTLELIFEEDARRWRPELAVPAWEIVPDTTLTKAVEARLNFLEAKNSLKKWEDREDIAPWVRDIRLVISIHGMHWSGYIFNDYAQALKIVRWVTQRIDGKSVLVFLPAWDGRYYWNYPEYRPDPRMGGDKGFKSLIDGIHAAGAHAMPMFGGNCANAYFADYKKFGPQSPLISGTGTVDQGNSPDWDLFRNRDTGWQQWLNPGAPAWQDYLVGRVDSLLSQFNFDAVFFDTQPDPNNDAHYSPLHGLKQICDRLRSHHNELLISTESSNDLSISFVPVNHTPGGLNNWPNRYIRRFAYLAEGEPAHGSTGVEEDGTIPYNLAELLQRYDWPTVSFVGDTLAAAQDKVAAVIDQAKRRNVS